MEEHVSSAGRLVRSAGVSRLGADARELRSLRCRRLTMPTFQYEAMNQAGQEVKDEIDAQSAEDAIAKIRSHGLLPHQGPGEGRQEGRQAGKAAPPAAGAKKKKAVGGHRQGQDQGAHPVHPPALHAAGRRPADPAQPAHPRAAAEARHAPGDPPQRGRGRRGRRDAVRGHGQPPQGLRPAVQQHGARPARRAACSTSSSSAWPTSWRRPSASRRKVIGAMIYPIVVITFAVADRARAS